MHDSLFWQPAEKLDHMLEDKKVYTWCVRVRGGAYGFSLPMEPVRSENGQTVCRVNGATRAQIDALAAEMRTRGCEMLLALKQMPV